MTILIIILCNKIFPSDTRLKQSPVDAICNKIILIRKEGVSVFWTLEYFNASEPLVAKCASWELCWEFRKLREWSRTLQVVVGRVLSNVTRTSVLLILSALESILPNSRREKNFNIDFINISHTHLWYQVSQFVLKSAPLGLKWEPDRALKYYSVGRVTFEGKLDRF